MREKKKPTCKKCYIAWYGEPELSMVRVYIRYKGKWKPIGWICPNCGYIQLEKVPLKQFKMWIETESD